MKLLVLALAAVIAIPLVVRAAPPQITSQGRIDNIGKIRPVTGISNVDVRFLNDARTVNWIEIKSSELAASRSTSIWVKGYAATMISDHQMSQDELLQIAHGEGIELWTDVPKAAEAEVAKLAALNGSQFDTAYRALQIKGHQMAAQKFAAEIKNGTNAQARYYAVNTLPAVKMHLKMAQRKAMK